jgi:maleamate amidohydrolase
MSEDRFRDRMEELGEGFDPARDGISARWGGDVGAFYAERGIGARTGFGERPGILVIDMAVAFNDPAYGVGADQTATVEAIARLLPVARRAGCPVFYLTTAYGPEGREGGMFVRKVPALLELQEGDPGVEIDPRLAPVSGEPVVVKRFSSPFFMTNLLAMLIDERVDTLVLTGCSTSGCVRAAALDGVSYGFRIVVPEEAVSDRAEGPHWANLFDIDAKYGDVLPLADVIAHLEGRGTGARQQPPPPTSAGGER